MLQSGEIIIPLRSKYNFIMEITSHKIFYKYNRMRSRFIGLSLDNKQETDRITYFVQNVDSCIDEYTMTTHRTDDSLRIPLQDKDYIIDCLTY